MKSFEKLLKEQINLLRPLRTRMGNPKVGEWLSFKEESGQTFQEYLDSNPTLARGNRRIIYIQPLGNLSNPERKIITLTAEFMSLFYNLSKVVAEDIPLSGIPPYAQRNHPIWEDHQILSKYVMDRILKPRLPKNAAAYIAFTAEDLWPGKGWNFVFGQASLLHRVGVWSIYRNGNPEKSEKDFRLCLLRTIKTGAHETSHIFSMEHCILYNCLMNGSNSREEADRRPLACCPECMAKICWVSRTEPLERYKNLAKFCMNQGLNNEVNFYQKHIDALNLS